jgi:hypothetical protein
MRSTFERFGGYCAVLGGIAGFLYSLSFIFLKNDVLSALFLLLGGFFTTAAIIALYERLKETDSTFALWGFLLVFAGALGSMIHGGYDLSNVLHPPATVNADLPSAIDPRGLLTFGLTGIGLFIFAWLLSRDGNFPGTLAYLGYLSAILMIILYLGRLIILQATSLAIGIPALLEGFLVNPIWYIWLGLIFLRGGNTSLRR